MEKSTLYKNKLRFIDGSSNVADIEYVNDSINFNKTVSFGGGVQANSLTVSSGSSLVVSALSALNLKGSTTGTLTVEANANTTDHTLIMPATQGSASTVLTNDGSGNLSWTAAGGGSGGGSNTSLVWAIEGRVNLPTTTTSITQLSLDLQDPSGSINYPNMYSLQEYGAIHRSGNVITVSSTGWYEIKLTMSHPAAAIITAGGTQQSSGTQSRLFLSYNGLSGGTYFVPFAPMESNPTVAYCMGGSITKYFIAGTTFSFYYGFQTAVSNEEYFVTSSLTNIQYMNANEPIFTGATSLLAGTTGGVPIPLAGQQDFYLRGNGNWQPLNILNVSDGSQTAPSYSFTNDNNTGMYSSNDDNIDFSTGGTRRLNISGTGLRGMLGTEAWPSYSFMDEPNTGMYISSPEELAFTTGGTTRLSILSSGNINIRNNKIINSSSTSFNTQYGTSALNSVTSGQHNTAIGYQALQNISDRSGLTAVGYRALSSNTSGGFSTCVGYRAGTSLTSGSHMTAVGYQAGQNCNGDDNVGIGSYACGSTSGSRNTCVGNFCGDINSTGSDNTMVGYLCRINSPLFTVNHSVGIGSECVLRGSNEVVLGDEIYTNKVRSGRDGDVSLGTSTYRFSVLYAATPTINTSDATQKIIEGESIGLDEIMKLKPVKYKWIDKPDVVDENGVVVSAGLKHTRQHYGFLAQDIETLIKNGDFPDSGLFIKTGVSEDGNDINVKDITDETKIKQFNYGLRYSELIAPLVKAVQELNNRIKILESKI